MKPSCLLSGRKFILQHIFALAALTVALVAGGGAAWRQCSENSPEILLLWVLALWLGIRAAAGFRTLSESERFYAQLGGWGCLLLCAVMFVFPPFPVAEINRVLVAFGVIGGILIFFEGAAGLRAWTVPLLCLPVIAFCDSLWLWIGYPLRLGATELCVGGMKLLGFAITNEYTTIRFDGAAMAITDYCGGIQQLEALIVLCALIAGGTQRNAGLRLVHFLCLFPSLVLANALRLMLMLLAYRVWGAGVLVGVWHDAFGYFQVIATVVVFVLMGIWLSWSTGKDKP